MTTESKTIRKQLSEYLEGRGFRPFEDGYVHTGLDDYYVDLSDEDYAWELSRLDDADDPDGIARPYWAQLAEGDTLAELIAALAFYAPSLEARQRC